MAPGRRVAVIVMVAAFGLVAFIAARSAAPGVTVDRASIVTARVERGSLIREARGTGTLMAENARVIAAETSGRVEAIRISAGQAVLPASTIIALSNAEVEEQAADARAAVTFAQADLAAAHAGLTQQQMSLRAECAQLDGEWEEADARARSMEQLAKAGIASAAELRVATVRAEALRKRAAIARSRLDTGALEVDALLVAKKASLAQAEARAQLRARSLDTLHVKALLGGIVQEVLVETGQHVSPGDTLARIADPSALMARVHVPPAQARDVTAGLPARIDTHSGIVEGKVVRVDPAVREGAVTVDIALSGPAPSGVRHDSNIEAVIVLGRVDNTLVLRRPANVEDGSRVRLFRVDASGRSAGRVPVALGRGSATGIEVRSGLRHGDEVIISDTSAWQDEKAIRIR